MGSKGGGLSSGVQNSIQQDEAGLLNIANQQEANANQLFNLTEPGLQTAENFYSSLASGDPGSIMRAVAPGAQQISQATQGAKQNILATAPNGGERNLALEMADVGQGQQVGQLAAGSFLNSFGSLGQLANQGIGESQGASGQALSGLSSGASAASNLGQLQIQNQEAAMQNKGSALGGLGSLANMAGGIGGSVAEGLGGGGGAKDVMSSLAGFLVA